MLEGFFAPRSVAVVGVSRDEGKVGHFIFDNLLRSGFPGPVYPVNPGADEIHGHRCYHTIAELPAAPDLAIIAIPARAVPDAIDECGAAGIDSVIVISAGFKETGAEGAALERDLLSRARAHGIRVIGPNSLGLIAAHRHLNASFAPSLPPSGTISFMSQSGALGTAILDWSAGEGIGLAHFVSLGNKADLDETDLVRAWADDPESTVVVAYIEAISSGGAFVEAVSELTVRKPFIALKAGRSDAGARAVSSHTGSLAGSEAAYEAAFLRAGIIRARSVQELFDFASAFSRQPLPARPGLAILTNAGGPAILATDAADEYGVTLARLDTITVTGLHACLPPEAALQNPVDVLGDAPVQRYRDAAAILVRDPEVHSLLVILTPQAMTEALETASAIAEIARDSGVTTVACFMGDLSVTEARELLRDRNIPNFPFPERAVRALWAMESYRNHLARPSHRTSTLSVDRDAAVTEVRATIAASRTFATDQAAIAIARAYGIPMPQSGLARDLAEARVLAASIGYPVAMKISSPDILHKTDIGGIKLGIADVVELSAAYEMLLGNVRERLADARIWGVTVQAMVPAGREVIIGVERDPQFGPLLMFGLGGIYVELMRDVTFRLCPVTPEEASQMIARIRGHGVLGSARGRPSADIDALIDVIVRVSALATDIAEITELDINPLIVGDAGTGALAADIRIGIGGAP